MHYALYRKYRPKTFGEIIGQEHITDTLKVQIKSGQFSHSYLFTGTRGTGKTSTAKILARAVNCLDPKDGEPCNECEICKGLLSGEIYDVVEMDAASNNGVDSIRQIRDEIMFTPMKTKFKVYIIDEVHMLSSGAFNALLKTLEEPPEHVIFILATTEAHKIPATILSRCQRFDMRRLSMQAIASHLKNIAEKEGRTFPEDIIYTVASLADGSVRDSLSILDKVMETEDPYMIKAALGVCDTDLLFSLSEAVAKGDVDALFSAVADFYSSSKDFSVLIHGLLEHFRLLLTARTTSSPEKFIERSKEDTDKYKKQSVLFGIEQILYILDTLRDSLANIPRSPDKRAETEICLLKCAKPELSKNQSPVAARLSKIENMLLSGNIPLNKTTASENYETVPKAEKGTVLPSAENFEEAKVETAVSGNLRTESSVSEIKSEVKNEIKSETGVKTENTKKKSSVSAMSPSDYFGDFEDISDGDSETLKNTVTAEKAVFAKAVSDESSSEYKEYLSMKDVAANAKKLDRMIGMTLALSCEAVYKDKELLILCKTNKDKDSLSTPEAKKIIENALKETGKASYRVKIEVGAKENYLSRNQKELSDLYEHFEDSDLFSF